MPTPRFASREEYLAWRGGQTAAAPLVPSAAPSSEAPNSKQSLKDAFSGLPAWAWLFIVGCFAVPVVSFGGAIPGALGFGGAAGCANIAKKPGWDVLPRVLVCAAITGGVWLVFVVFLAAFANIGK